MCSRNRTGKRTSPFIRTEETGCHLKSLLESRGLSVKDVQQYLGFSCPQSIYRWLNGSALPSLDNLYALQGLFQMPMEQLIRGSFSGRFSAGPEEGEKREQKEGGDFRTLLSLCARLSAFSRLCSPQ